jgi:hypothetical protein
LAFELLLAGDLLITVPSRQQTGDLASADVRSLAAADKLSSLSVAQLKTFCKDNKLGLPKKKDELIANIKKHFGSSGAKEE